MRSRDKKTNQIKPHKKWWRIACLAIGLGWLVYPYRKKIKKQISQQTNRFALILNEECKHMPDKVLSLRSKIKRNVKDFFIPTDSNDHQPHGLSTRLLKIYAVVLVLIKVVTIGFLFFTYPSPAVLSQKISQEIFDLTNVARSEENVNSLNWNDELARAAQAKADDMVSSNYFAHIGPDGKQPWEWINKGSYYFLYMGENLAMDFSSAQIAQSAFQQSPTHWKNIMNPKYQDMGVGVAVGNIDGRETIVLVEFFGAQKTVQPLVPIAQASETPLVAATTPTQVSPETQSLSEPPVVVKPTETKPTAPAEVVNNNPTQPTVVENQPTEVTETPVVDNSPIDNSATVTIDTNVATDNSLALAPVSQELVGEIVVPEKVEMADNPVVVASTNELVQKGLVEYVIIFSRYALLLFLVVLSVMLLINVLVKPHIQHSQVIIQSLGVILLVSTLLLTKFHLVEEIQQVLIF